MANGDCSIGTEELILWQAMIKCCHEFTAVSQGLCMVFEDAQGLQDLIRQEHRKAHGIINGIDTEVGIL